ncbi:hypothetical protein JTB14_017109 [Gonioctena quinquepunctata]|nr:hypothetical protein JTB14_017109 [Gonioctena quinquepunctata]
MISSCIFFLEFGYKKKSRRLRSFRITNYRNFYQTDQRIYRLPISSPSNVFDKLRLDRLATPGWDTPTEVGVLPGARSGGAHTDLISGTQGGHVVPGYRSLAATDQLVVWKNDNKISCHPDGGCDEPSSYSRCLTDMTSGASTAGIIPQKSETRGRGITVTYSRQQISTVEPMCYKNNEDIHHQFRKGKHSKG